MKKMVCMNETFHSQERKMRKIKRKNIKPCSLNNKKIQRNVLLKDLRLNDHNVAFYPQAKKLEPTCTA